MQFQILLFNIQFNLHNMLLNTVKARILCCLTWTKINPVVSIMLDKFDISTN